LAADVEVVLAVELAGFLAGGVIVGTVIAGATIAGAVELSVKPAAEVAFLTTGAGATAAT
jgi:hypothetical protein